jgi:putative DNA primase/helicase
MCNTWYIYNYKIGIYECISDSFTKKVFKTIFDEPDTEVWKTGYENQYISALASDVDHLNAIPVNPYKVCFKNGIVNLKDGTISNHSPEEIHTVLIPHNYEPNADCPTFKRFISEIMEDDTERVAIIQEMLAYCFYRKIQNTQKVYVFLGHGSNGKSLLCNVITAVLGKENVSSVPLESLGERFSMQNMDDKLANISCEGDGSRLKNVSMLKQLSSGDTTEIEKKFKDSYSTKLTSKFILCTNSMFTTNDISDGFYRRLMIIPFNRKYIDLPPNGQREEGKFYVDANLEDNLLEEGEIQGIINWAMEGFQRFSSNNFSLTSSTVCAEALNNYITRNDYIFAFIRDCLEISKGARVKRSELYKEFLTYISRNGFKNVNLNNGQFLDRLKDTLKTKFNFEYRVVKSKEYYVLNMKLR